MFDIPVRFGFTCLSSAGSAGDWEEAYDIFPCVAGESEVCRWHPHFGSFVAGEGLSVCCWIHVCCFKNPSHLLLNPLFLLFESDMLAGFYHGSSHFLFVGQLLFFSLGLQGFYETDVSWLYINILYIYIYINPCKPFVLPLLNISLTIVKCVPFNHLQ